MRPPHRTAPVPLILAILAGGFAAASPHGQVTTRPMTFHSAPLDPATFKKQYTPPQIAMLEKLNRRDVEHLVRLKELIVPDPWPADESDELAYGLMPAIWDWAAERSKAIIVLQPEQLFGAYEFGKLVRWGPVSTGRKDTPTPAGVFNLTWKAKSRTSTDNDQWLLKWYFNFINSRGVSFHQFELPGYAASHACVRLLERDAMWFYTWGEQWKLSPNGRDILQQGTTVVVSGEYGHDKPGPWTSIDWWKGLPVQIR